MKVLTAFHNVVKVKVFVNPSEATHETCCLQLDSESVENLNESIKSESFYNFSHCYESESVCQSVRRYARNLLFTTGQ